MIALYLQASLIAFTALENIIFDQIQTTQHVKKKLISIVIYTIVAPLFWLYLRLIMWTSNVERIGEDKAEQLYEKDQGHVYVFWHNQQFMMPLIRPDRNIRPLVSDSRDGDYMAWLAKSFGNTPIRGSSSRGGVQALKQMIRLLKDGAELAIATDGPRGPAFKVKPGVVQLAQSTGAPIVPVAYSATNKKRFSSWDQSFIPYPFGRLVIVYGDPIYLERSISLDDGVRIVQQGLDAVNTAAQNAAI